MGREYSGTENTQRKGGYAQRAHEGGRKMRRAKRAKQS